MLAIMSPMNFSNLDHSGIMSASNTTPCIPALYISRIMRSLFQVGSRPLWLHHRFHSSVAVSENKGEFHKGGGSHRDLTPSKDCTPYKSMKLSRHCRRLRSYLGVNPVTIRRVLQNSKFSITVGNLARR
jgi:hypothetical protein